MNNTQLTDIEHPGLHDVLWGRGGHTTCHPGNVRYRNLTQNYRDAFKCAGKIRRLEIANEIVQKWRDQNPPGRFLVMSEPEKGNDSFWHDIGDRGALQKVMGSLRQRKPKTDEGFSSTFQQTVKLSQHAANDAAQSTTDMNPYSNWQQKFSTVANTGLVSQWVSPQLMNNTVIGLPSAPNQPPSVMANPSPFPNLFADALTQSSTTSIVVSEDEAAGSECNTLTSSQCHRQNPSFTLNPGGSEDVPLAAVLTYDIFEEDLQSGIPLFGSGNSNLWKMSEISFSASPEGTNIGAQDASLNLLFSQESRDPFSL